MKWTHRFYDLKRGDACPICAQAGACTHGSAGTFGSIEREPMPNYRYELRRRSEVVATGHFSREEPLEIGEFRSGVLRAPGGGSVAQLERLMVARRCSPCA
jgi:hypothetical protein